MLVRSPGVTALATIALTLGIGGNTAIFSVVNAVLLRPLPVSDADRLVWIWANSPSRNLTYAFTAYSTYMPSGRRGAHRSSPCPRTRPIRQPSSSATAWSAWTFST